MAKISRFEDIEAWQLGRVMAREIDELLENNSKLRDFSLKNQIYRSSGSVMDNIAEGFERNGRREFIQFLSIAKGSCGEFRSQLYRLLDKKVINQQEFDKFYNDAIIISKKLANFITYLLESENKGYKFSEPETQYGEFAIELPSTFNF